jgi:hypothetical protein
MDIFELLVWAGLALGFIALIIFVDIGDGDD